jgi:hypothetical protein
MDGPVWELRFIDGRGASFYTTADVTADIGKPGMVRSIPVAAQVFQGSAVANALAAFAGGDVVELHANMAAIAYALRHDPSVP